MEMAWARASSQRKVGLEYKLQETETKEAERQKGRRRRRRREQ
jgi:hypothetical protein